MAAADMMGVRSMHLDTAEEPAEAKKSREETQSEEEAWIRTNEDWI